MGFVNQEKAIKMKVPFKDKTQLHYAGIYRESQIEWKDNYEFIDTLTYAGYNRGRSSINFMFVGTDDMKYTMFVSELNKIIWKMINCKISGKWTFMKKGQNYGITAIEEDCFDCINRFTCNKFIDFNNDSSDYPGICDNYEALLRCHECGRLTELNIEAEYFWCANCEIKIKRKLT